MFLRKSTLVKNSQAKISEATCNTKLLDVILCFLIRNTV